ncbi:hypothetical protein CHS0354_029860 [Potamilus streckersoni]|uniref:C1q domain-containing protein n=1 Tax=Potamilus streckersoni TaxID=2493646 RepID=A0AAE0TH72_9BIVA|nr:hypothetical protein CHS0354_029860 [Potamilus streckersoni]
MVRKYNLFSTFVIYAIIWKINGQLTQDLTQSLLTLISEENILRGDMEREAAQLSAEIIQLQTERQQALCGCTNNSSPFAFSAALKNNISNLGQRQQVVFDRVINNIGNAYDARHGTFTAQVAGVYEFSVTVLSQGGNFIGAEIVKNGEPVAKARTGDASYYTMGTNIVTLQLQKGDDVWIEHISETDSNKLEGQSFTTFSGHLIL